MNWWWGGYSGPPTAAIERLIEKSMPERNNTPEDRNQTRYCNALLLLEYAKVRGRCTARTGWAIGNILSQLEPER